jgi:hypothetical protein
MDLREIGLGGCGLDSTGSGQGPVAGCCECGDEPSCSCATELVSGHSAPPRRQTAERCCLQRADVLTHGGDCHQETDVWTASGGADAVGRHVALPGQSVGTDPRQLLHWSRSTAPVMAS